MTRSIKADDLVINVKAAAVVAAHPEVAAEAVHYAFQRNLLSAWHK
jgi:hypothetical protein